MTAKRNLGLAALASVMVLAGCEREVILQGERFPVRADLEASIPSAGNPAPRAASDRPANQSVAISLPAQSAGNWAQRGGNAQHSNPHGALSAAPRLVWTANIGSGSSRKNRISAAPVAADGRVVTMDAQDQVVATSTSGATLWSTNVAAPFDRGGAVSGGGLALGGGKAFVSTGYGELLALDLASGKILWRHRIDSPAAGAPTVDGDTVYVAGRDGTGWAIATTNGKVKWTFTGMPGGLSVASAAAPAVDGRNVIFAFPSGELAAAVKINGTRAWGAPVTGQRVGRGYAGLTDITGDPVVIGGTIYAGTAAGRTAAIDAGNGERKWTAVEGAMNAPLVVGGSVFVVNDEAKLVRMDAASGKVIWMADMPYFVNETPKKRQAITAHYGPVLAGGRVAVVSGDGVLRLFDPTNGNLVHTAQIPGGAASAPALAGGMLYVVSNNGQLHAFR